MNFSEFNEQTTFNNHILSNHVWGDQLIKQEAQERKERERIGLEKYKIQIEKEKEAFWSEQRETTRGFRIDIFKNKNKDGHLKFV